MRFQSRTKERLLVAQFMVPMLLVLSILGYFELGGEHCLEHMASQGQCDAARGAMTMAWLCLFGFSVIIFYSIYFFEHISKIEDTHKMIDLAKGLDRELMMEIHKMEKYFHAMQLFQMLLSTSWFPEVCELFMRIPNEEHVDQEEKRKVMDIFIEGVLTGVQAEIEGRSLKALREMGEAGFRPMVTAAIDLGEVLGSRQILNRMAQPGRRLAHEHTNIAPAIDNFCRQCQVEDGTENRIRESISRIAAITQ